ncbi:MAG: T9SS type A sorting domain-containing protein [Acidobacteriota bacterium]
MTPQLRTLLLRALAPLFSFFLALPLFAAGKVYLVLGSDTAIWDGMNVARFDPHYNGALYTDPAQNAYKVMDPAWRLGLVDSYGTPMKLTWWMMAGSIYRYADNTDVPLGNTMTLYLMKKYHGDRIRQYGDELSLHYHTFAWTDYNGDGKYYWNQAKGFDECRDDFDVIVAQFLLEENTYPVSFRSGWHYMDNAWQRRLNELLLYSMHDDYPAKRYVTNEPIDNNYDWSLSSSAWVPFRPSDANYQLDGGTGGWNLRSKHIGSTTQAMINGMFSEASKGTDQVACLWGHLPETDFLDNLKKIDGLAHTAEAQYPGVKFVYCTAVEAMQRWRGSTDSVAPVLTFTSQTNGDNVTFSITSNEPIFQKQPFVALKDIYERAFVLACTKTGENSWSAASPVKASWIAKAAAAITDTMGNLSTKHLRFLPDDIYLDNKDSGYSEPRGSWTTTTNASWGTDARQAVLAENDSVQACWTTKIPQTGNYNFFIEIPTYANAAFNSVFRVRSGATVLAEKRFPDMVWSRTWNHIATLMLSAGTEVTVERVVDGKGQAGRIVAADVVKISPLVRDRVIQSSKLVVDLGEISQSDTAKTELTITNSGVASLSIASIAASNPSVIFPSGIAREVPAMTSITVPVRVYSDAKQLIADTIRIRSNDPLTPELKIPLKANVIGYFVVADNDDPTSYREIGSWSKSVATDGYGATSRYASLGPKAKAIFTKTLPKSGIYDIYEIMPKTVNASTRARYVYKINGVVQDSVFIDQNEGSGTWRGIMRRMLPARVPIEVEVSDASINTAGNFVLRADAIRFMLKLETAVARDAASAVPSSYALGPNYPNPFNPSTALRFALPSRSHVRLEVFNTVGQSVAVIEDGVMDAGTYSASWNASSAPSGLYFLRMRAESVDAPSGSFTQTRKMLLLR